MKPTAELKPRFREEDIDAALRRAAVAARMLGERTQTPVYVLRQGQIVNLRQSGAECHDGRPQ